MARKTSRDEQAAQTRAHILETALTLIAEHGYRGTSTRRIAAAAGVSEGLIFHHFARKRDLIAGIGETRETLAHQVVTLAAEARDVPVEIILPAIARRFVEILIAGDTDARLFQVMLAESRTDPELRDLFRETSNRVVTALSAYLEARVAVGELREDLPCEAAAQNLLGSFLWFFLAGTLDSEPDARTAATRFTEQVIALWMRGARAR